MKQIALSLLCIPAACLLLTGCSSSSEPNQKAVDALSNLGGEVQPMEEADGTSSDETMAKPTKAIATFGNGCYWCTESVFQEFEGIESVVSGFSGGENLDVTYEEVCSGLTGHAEVVQITYDPNKVSFATLLQAFFLTHDPTTLNRQGADTGTQYRSVVFYHDDEQKQLAEKAIEELTKAGAFGDPIVTEVSPYENFVTAKKDHQDYFEKNPRDGYCLYNIPSKVAKVRKVFKDKVKP